MDRQPIAQVTPVEAAWQTAVAEAARRPELQAQVAQRAEALYPRFAAAYARLRTLPRRLRRGMQRQWRRSLAGVALLVALGLAPGWAATLNVTGGCTLADAITAANTDTATGACPAGSGADTLVLAAGSVHTLTGALPTISTQITLQGNGSTIERPSRHPRSGS